MIPRFTSRMLGAMAALFAMSVAAFAAARVDLVPDFVPGETLIYEIQSRTSTAGTSVTPITNPEGGSQSSLSLSLREKLEILSVARESKGDTLRVRLTWEKSQADSQNDVVNPAAPDATASYQKLEGHSFEFTLGPAGQILNFTGLEDVLPGGVPLPDTLAWTSSLLAGSQFPAGGISTGQKWSANTQIGGVPLAGLSWQIASTYQRNEPCRAIAAAAAMPASSAASTQPDQCAVIFSQMAIPAPKSSRSEATPDDYLRRGLRTSGTWTGSGNAIAAISLSDGLLTSATETTTQDMDYEIKSASTGSTIHYTGKSENQLGITLVAASGRRTQSGN